MCWTSAGLLWNINLSDAKLQEEQPEEDIVAMFCN